MNYALVLISSLAAAFASYFLKIASGSGKIPAILKSRYLYVGGALYTASAFISIALLKRMPFSVLLPLGGICYVWTILISRGFLGERIGARKIAGIALIITGIALVAR
jgi:multidrug transporter EmrE-like cation transporter